MGMIGRIFATLFGEGRNVVRETAEVFRENAEAAAVREAIGQTDARHQYAAEFAAPRRGVFNGVMDGLNRLPRPLLAFGTIGLFVVAMIDPVWFASRMQGIALVPEPLWWLMGAIVSFYFGARHQAHAQDFQRSIAETLVRAPSILQAGEQFERAHADTPQVASTKTSSDLTIQTTQSTINPALEAWRARKP